MRPAASLSWALVIALSIAAGATSCFVTLAVAGREPAAAAAQPRAAVDCELAQRLNALQQRVDACLAALREPGQPTSPVRTAVASGAAAEPEAPLLQRIDQLEQRQSQMLAAARPAAGERLDRTAPVQQGEIDALAALAQRDFAAAQRTTVMLTAGEVAARFGFPDEAGASNDGGFYWTYRHLGPDGQPDGHLMLDFRDGRVAFHDLHIEGR